jgi:hypothetical protein
MDENAIPSRVYAQQTRTNRQFSPRTKSQHGRFNSPGNLDSDRALYRPEIGGMSSRRRGRGITGRQAKNVGLQVDNAAYASHIRKEQHEGK